MTLKPTRPQFAARGGFTLVEMLTVIVIIGILAGLTTAGAIAARNAVRRSIIVSDVKQLEIALNNYKGEVGEFPPDFAFCEEATTRGNAARSRVVNHLRKAFPRMRLPGADDNTKFAAFCAAYGATAGPAANQLNPSTALILWLGGMLDPTTRKPMGFSEDPTNPFKAGEPRTKPYFDFDSTRIPAGTAQYMQPKVQPPAPYVYFRAVKNNASGNFEYGDANDSGAFQPFSYPPLALAGDNFCVPYLEDAADIALLATPVDTTNPTRRLRLWRAPETYQIIAAGLDGVFSTNTPAAPSPFRFSKIGENFTDGDYNNLASFAEGELEKEL